MKFFSWQTIRLIFAVGNFPLPQNARRLLVCQVPWINWTQPNTVQGKEKYAAKIHKYILTTVIFARKNCTFVTFRVKSILCSCFLECIQTRITENGFNCCLWEPNYIPGTTSKRCRWSLLKPSWKLYFLKKPMIYSFKTHEGLVD